MSGSSVHEDRLITRSQIGLLAGVARPTVTSWGRDPQFPGPVRAGGAELFHQSEVLGWLDTRPIPRRFRGVSESTGATYGDRARRALRGQDATEEGDAVDAVSPAPAPHLLADHLDRQRVRELMGQLVDRVRGAASVIDYLNLLLCLHFLRRARGSSWEGVLRRADALRGSDGARALLDHIGAAADEQMKLVGAVPGMREALLHLEPRTYDDLKRVVEQTGQLGRDAFRLILDEYETRARLRSGEFFTPRAVARIMVDAAIRECSEGPPATLYDPYARGGELLAEATAACVGKGGDPAGLGIVGYSHGLATARLTSMNLALQGARPRVRLTRDAPWNSTTGPHHAARFDLTLINPPFNMSDAAGKARTQGAWPYGPPPVGNDNFAHVQHVLGSLSERGAAAMVMPSKAGNSANSAEVAIRRNMVEAGVVKCVIALPERLFSGTQVPVSVWILVHPSRGCEEVLFLDARSLGIKHKAKRVLQEDDVEAVLAAVSRRGIAHPGRERQGEVPSAVVTRAALRQDGYSLSPTDHIRAGQSVRGAVDSAFERASARVEACLLDAREADESAGAQDFWLQQSSPGEGRGGVALSDLCEIKAGPSYSLLREAQRRPDGTIPLVFPKHVRNGRIEGAGDRCVTEELARRLRAFRLEAGDIVCIRSGAMGPPALVREAEAGWLMSTNLLRLRMRTGVQVDPGYLLACLGRPDAVAWVRDRATATGAPSISAEALGHQKVGLPPYAEQRRIVKALTALDDQATAHTRLAAAVLDVRAAMVERQMSAP